MKNYIKVSVFIFILSFNITAKSDNIQFDTEYCKTVSSTYDIVKCIQEEIQIEDRRLNKFYQIAISKIEYYRKDDLRDIQRAWIVYRDKKCNFYYHKYSGSGGLIDSVECILNETKNRIKEIKQLY